MSGAPYGHGGKRAPAPPYRSFWFDCDSTLSAVEGVDELTRDLPADVQRAIKALTEQAMNGQAPLAAVYEQRLAALQPTAEKMAAIARLYAEHVVPHTAEVIAALQALGKSVGVISGGMLPGVLPFAHALGVPDERVLAVPLLFDSAGRYVDFDRTSPLWQNGGKTLVLQQRPSSERPAVLVGDGVTDLEASPAVELFLGFGGVARRDAVVRGADVFLDGADLRPLLRVALSADEQDRLRANARFAALLG